MGESSGVRSGVVIFPLTLDGSEYSILSEEEGCWVLVGVVIGSAENSEVHDNDPGVESEFLSIPLFLLKILSEEMVEGMVVAIEFAEDDPSIESEWLDSVPSKLLEEVV